MMIEVILVATVMTIAYTLLGGLVIGFLNGFKNKKIMIDGAKFILKLMLITDVITVIIFLVCM